ncbi:isoaspartyl peptidase/L-asparaginase [Qipengyuania sp. JC766]|uniref:isoaspartyl peptidase/L-asparaginase family protein n=1 Tax=Qipengyuania sp. JC766 TaxID=3232139 RepID=UPI0034588596
MVLAPAALAQEALPDEDPRWSIAIHGGAGTILRENMTAEQEAEYRAALQAALDAGARVLREGGSAMDAVKAAIVPMEDSPLFNAGRGSVFTWDGRIEMDAAIMDGRDRSAGAVTGVTSIRNPILLADAVRDDGRHVFLSGAGAEQFVRDMAPGIATEPPAYFETDRRREALERMKADRLSAQDVDHKYGTVGAVALDMDGNLAAGTSTGGMTGKRWGRIGDAPVIGAGTYADNRSCAVSATGAGEYFIRVGVAQEICTLLKVGRTMDPEAVASAISKAMNSPEDADKSIPLVELIAIPVAPEVTQHISDSVMAEVKELGGDGGVIVVTAEGHTIFSFNTPGMYRGRADSAGLNEVAIYGEDAAD